MSSTVFDDRIYSIVPQSSFIKIQTAFLTDLCQPTQELPINMDPLWFAWCRFAFSVIVYGGLAGPHFFEELLNLRWVHTQNIHEGYILIPRWSGHIPIFIEDPVICCTSSLRTLTMKDQQSKPKLGDSSQPLGALVPYWSNLSGHHIDSETRYVKEQFTKWLEALGRQAIVTERITPMRLAQLARGRLVKIYSPTVVGAILGLHRFNPAPMSQITGFGSYRSSPSLQLIAPQDRPNIQSNVKVPRIRLPILQEKPQMRVPKIPPENELPSSFQRIREIVTQYSRSEKKPAYRKRPKVLKILRSQTSQMEQELGKNWPLDWKEYLRSLGQTLPLWKIEGINTVLIIHWMIRLVRTSPPNTVEARLNDLAKLLRVGNLGLLTMLKERDFDKIILGLDITARSKERMTSTIRAFFQFMRSSLNMSVPDIGLWYIGWVNSVNEYPLLLLRDFKKILERIDTGKPEVISAALLGYFFGLRISEVCDLRLGHLWFGSSPTVFVQQSKRGKSRSIEGIEIPLDVVNFLDDFRAARLKRVGDDLDQPLLVNAKGDPMSRQHLSRLWGDAARRSGINQTSLKSYSKFHALRHACANRCLALKIPLVEIARMLGHSSIDTTVRTYVHCFHFLQKDQLEKFAIQQKELRFTSVGVARLLWVTPRRARQILVENQVAFFTEGGKRIYCVDPVLDLLSSNSLLSEG